MHTHTITIGKIAPDLEELSEVLVNATVQMMPAHYG
jgi:hypothetical protein